ncbi:MAG: DUF6062 family protein [Bacteroidota bacterium]
MTAFEKLLLSKIKKEPRCPICVLVQEQELSLLSHLQYDVSLHERVRKSIAGENGFCDFHFRQFRKIANNRTNAALLLAFIEEYRKGVQRSRRNGFPKLAHCRLCKALEEYDKKLEIIMAKILKNESYHKLYVKSSGLCLLHERTVERSLRSVEAKQWLKETQLRQLLSKIPMLEHVVTKSYYDTSAEERGTIPSIVEKFVGRKAIGL